MNVYNVLEIKENDETQCPMRKARKKLREIEKLKLKPNKNAQEYDKIKEEEIWRAIVEPVITTPETNDEVKNKKQNKRDKAKIKDLEGKLRKQNGNHLKYKQEIECKLRKQNETYLRYKQEMETKQRQIKMECDKLKKEVERLKMYKQSYHKTDDVNSDNDLKDKVMDEFYDLSSEMNNKDKALKKMLLKYHPDKNKNSEISIEITKILNEIRI